MMMMEQIIYIFLFSCIAFIPFATSSESEADFYRYLQQFGYTPKVEGRRLFSVLGQSTYNEGVKTFQRLYKLPVTGQLDEKTKRLMQRPRCGNPDLGSVESIGRPLNIDKPDTTASSSRGRLGSVKQPQNFVTQPNIWPGKHLKWFIEEYPKNQKQIVSHEHIRQIIAQAFHDWEKYSGLKFEMVNDKKSANLTIKFHSKDHGDGYPFDGQGATLAHAFYPSSGEVHFDDDEVFTDHYQETDEQYTLRLVAAHEIGHALGLSHSFEVDSLMFPVYKQFTTNYDISHDDQQGIQTLYGKPQSQTTTETESIRPTVSPVTPTGSSNTLPLHNWCPADFQTGCEGPDGELYLFKDHQVWRYRAKTKHSWDFQPELISGRFRALTDATITACVKSSTGYTYLFRNYRMWKLKTHWTADGPHVIRAKHYPQNPRVALLHQNSIYLLRNRLIYRLDEFNYEKDLEIRTIDTILNPPPDEYIRSGFTYAKRHYLFTKHQIFVYDSTKGNLLSGYPKPIANGWFACDAGSQASKLKKKATTTTTHRPNNERNNYDDYDHQYHHHHHHHHRKPKRPPPHSSHDHHHHHDD